MIVAELETPAHYVRIPVEVARTPDRLRRGLMRRAFLPAGEGMVLVFPREGRHSLWMRDTWISLDMIHVSAAGRVVGIVENARPHTDQSRTIDRPSLAVIEVNAGFARRHGITVGNVVRFYEIK